MANVKKCISGFLNLRNISLYRCQVQRCSSWPFSRPSDVSGSFPKVTVSQDSAEWKAVERVLPNPVVPLPPKHDSYPTPSGWVPQSAKAKDLPYFVRRTRFHNMPIYLERRDGGSRIITYIRYVEGDIWKFEEELKEYLTKKVQQPVYTLVDELCCKVRVRGNHTDNVAEFLLSKGL